MKYKTLLWSGCSHSFGNSMLDVFTGKNPNTAPVKWLHPKLAKDFPDVVTMADGIKAVNERAYPIQIGKKLGFENTFNLAMPGKGIEMHFRKVTSFIINNEDTIDFSKAVFCYQIPTFNRAEILDMRGGDSMIKFANFNFQSLDDINNSDDFTKNYYLNHFDFDYYVAKFLMYLYEYKGFIESKGITFLPFHFYDADSIINSYSNIYPYIKSETYMTGEYGMNNGRAVKYDGDMFPNRKTLVEKIQHWDIVYSSPNKVGTLQSDGYQNDNHWSPSGHDALANNLAPQLKEKLGI